VAEAAQRAAEAAQQVTETEQRRAREQAKANRQLRRLLVGLAGLLLLAAASGGVAWQQRQQAQREAHLARAHEWAAEAVNQLTVDPERSVWLALHALEASEAAGVGPLPEAEEALHQAVQATRIQVTLPHENIVARVGFSADGSHLITVDMKSVVRIWNLMTEAPTQQVPHELALPGPDPTEQPEDMPLAISPDGTQVAAALGEENAVAVWDITTNETLLRLTGHRGQLRQIAFSPDGQYLAVGTGVGEITIWDLSTGERQSKFVYGDAAQANVMALNPGGTRLVLVDNNSAHATVFDTSTGEVVLAPTGHIVAGLFGLALSPDERYAATGGGWDRSIRIWEANSGDEVSVVHGLAATAGVLAFSPNGQQLAAAQGSGSAKVWDPATGRELYALNGHTNRIVHLSYSLDGTRLASASLDQTVRVWDATPMHEWISLDINNAVAIGRSRVTLSVVQDLAFAPAQKPELLVLASSAWRVATSASGTLVYETPAHLWDLQTGEVLQRWHNEGTIYSLAFGSDGTRLVLLGNRRARLLDLGTGSELRSFTAKGASYLIGLALHPDGHQVAFLDCQGRAHLWDPAVDEIRLTGEILQDSCGDIYTLPMEYSPDGRWLAVAGPDHQARVYDLANDRVVYTLGEHREPLFSIAFSPTGGLLATGSDDTTIILWDLDTGMARLTMRGHNQGVTSLAFTPDGKLLASGSWDGHTKLWNVATGEERLTLFGQAGEVTAVAFSPDGKYLATGGTDGMIQVYLTRLDDLIALAQERVTRTLTTEECQKYLRLATCPVR
jgi:WD40 repeat protein